MWKSLRDDYIQSLAQKLVISCTLTKFYPDIRIQVKSSSSLRSSQRLRRQGNAINVTIKAMQLISSQNAESLRSGLESSIRLSMSGQGGGNTQTPPQRGKKWCFTWNNWHLGPLVNGQPRDERLRNKHLLKEFFKKKKASMYLVGVEVGEEKETPHLQGYVEFKERVRFSALKKLSQVIHWEKARGSRQENADYCSKSGTWFSFGPIGPTEHLEDPFENVAMHQWQKDITNICLKQCVPHSREIYWLTDEEGCAGKTSWAKHMCIKYQDTHGVLFVSGKASDMKFAIADMAENQGRYPKIIILGIPRARSSLAVSYPGLEELKDGIFFSTKYKSSMVIYNTPHIVVLANSKPLEGRLTSDRIKEWDLGILMRLEQAQLRQRRQDLLRRTTSLMSTGGNGELVDLEFQVPRLVRSNAVTEGDPAIQRIIRAARIERERLERSQENGQEEMKIDNDEL